MVATVINNAREGEHDGWDSITRNRNGDVRQAHLPSHTVLTSLANLTHLVAIYTILTISPPPCLVQLFVEDRQRTLRTSLQAYTALHVRLRIGTRRRLRIGEGS